MKVIHEDCDPNLANDKKLPYTAYLVEYVREGRIAYDIVNTTSGVEVFDEYYDKYKKDFKTMKQTEGRINPKLWNNQTTQAKKPNKPKKARG
tara:strand:- start:1206 stop:1481 length:276 start_codon:yes stop_codon:yes gene_type:complete